MSIIMKMNSTFHHEISHGINSRLLGSIVFAILLALGFTRIVRSKLFLAPVGIV
jgi:hypothetical protein